jgi:hypothetical protein
MSRDRRRQDRLDALARRFRILRSYSFYREEDLTPRCRHWHLRCGCMGTKERNRARDERTAMARELPHRKAEAPTMSPERTPLFVGQRTRSITERRRSNAAYCMPCTWDRVWEVTPDGR